MLQVETAPNFTKADLDEFIKDLRDNNFFLEVRADLLTQSFREFIGSKFFSEAQPDRRKDLFVQYETLNQLLAYLEEVE